MNDLAQHLHTGAARPELDAFARFNGSWNLEWSRPGDPDAPSTLAGELHFGTVLGGRAIQDIWIAPAGGPRCGPPQREEREKASTSESGSTAGRGIRSSR